MVHRMRRPGPIVHLKRLLVTAFSRFEPAQAVVHLAQVPYGVSEPQRIVGLPSDGNGLLKQGPGPVRLVQVQRDVTEPPQCHG